MPKKLPTISQIFQSNPETVASLDVWRQRVGEEEATKKMNKGSRRTKMIKDALWRYAKGEPYSEGIHDLETRAILNHVILAVKNHLGQFAGAALMLRSEKLGFCGQIPLVAEWDDEPAIVVVKVSDELKPMQFLQTDFMKLSAYSMLLANNLNESVTKGVIIRATPSEDEVITINTESYIDAFRAELERHHEFLEKPRVEESVDDGADGLAFFEQLAKEAPYV